MSIFLSFLSGITLFYVFPFFPVTAAILFFSLSTLIMKDAMGEKEASPKSTPPLTGGDKGEGENGITPTQPPPSRGRKWRRLSLPFLILLGFAYAFLRYAPPADNAAFYNREVVLECTAESSPQELSSGRFVNEIKVVSAVNAGTGAPLSIRQGQEMNIISPEGLPQHRRYLLAAKTAKDRERHNPGAMKNDGLYATLVEVREAEPLKGNPVYRWFQDSRDRLNHFFKNSFEGDSGALLASQTTGERSTMSEEIKDAFNSTGLAHLLSISGTHFGLFSALIFGLFRFIIRSMPHRILQRFTLYLSPSQAAALFALPFMFFYLALSGASIPALRSFLMINIFLLGLLIGRKGFWLNSLLFAAFVLCVWDPAALLSISFQLSFLAVLFIGTTLGDKVVTRNALRVKGDEWGFFRRIKELLKNSLTLSLTASLGTAPLVAYYFHYFSIISPLANLFITPFIGFILVPLSLVSSFIFIFTGHYPFPGLVAFLTDMALKGVKFFASVPFADIKIPAFPVIALIIFYTGLLVYFTKRLRPMLRYLLTSTSTLAFLGILFSPLLSGRNPLAVTYLDVGQGDSAVIEGYKGETIAIDAGRTGRELEGYLRYLGKRAVDVLVITHADDDHAAGALHVIKKFPVKEVWDNGLITYPENLLRNAVHRSLERGDEANAGGLTIQALHPYGGFYTFGDNEATAENNDSLVVRVAGQKSFLFAGDTAEEAEEDMLHLGAWLKSDVIKVSHHGSRTSSGEDFLSAVSPVVAVISVGRDNPYGHPHGETLERLRGVKLYRTDRDGAVKITETPGGLTVKTYSDCMFERVRSLPGEWRNIRRLFARW
ncbi:MAG: DNA internalization-related competence protein ComEC/Rec2 [Nitrospirae bacterium]|nr:DNA internalization-related competence protein ComEC/Rec2 [Nitrospirota bacterium]